MTSDIIDLIHKRDSLKKRAINSKTIMDWNIYKKARNTVNNAIKMCKSKYYKEACFTHRKDPGKLWSTINEISSRKPPISIVKNLKVGRQELTNSIDFAEAFNEHFSTIGYKLASKIDSSNAQKSFYEYLPTLTNSVFGIEPTCSARVLKLMLKVSD